MKDADRSNEGRGTDVEGLTLRSFHFFFARVIFQKQNQNLVEKMHIAKNLIEVKSLSFFFSSLPILHFLQEELPALISMQTGFLDWS